MTVTTYAQWVADGQPWKPAAPAKILTDCATRHNVGWGIIGDVNTHLNVDFPEDHAPYSHTPWPGEQPYPYVLAADLYTIDVRVARRIIDAKRSGRLPCLKYINWIDEQGACWHTSWQPDEATRSSTDKGHIHMSFRTDHTTCTHAIGFDPFIEEDGMEQSEPVQAWGGKARPVQVGWVLGDLENLRDWLCSQPTDTTIAPPAPGSRIDIIFRAAQRVLTWQPATDVAAVLSDAQVQMIIDGLAAKLPPELSKADVDAAVKDALREGTGG